MSDVDKIQIQDGTILNIKDSTARNNINSLSNSINDLDNKISSVASGSPAGAFATLDDLKNSQTTDKTKIYVVQENGNWYYFNGSDWVSGGVYQATEIADNSINLFNTDFMNQGYNKFLALETVAKGITISKNNDGYINLIGVASGSPANAPFAKFKIDKTGTYHLFKNIVKGVSPTIYIYKESDQSTIIKTIPANTNNIDLNLDVGIYTANLYVAQGTNFDTKMYISLLNKEDMNNFSNNYFKPSIKTLYCNYINREEYPIIEPLKLPIISSLKQNIGTIDLNNLTLKLVKPLYVIYNNLYNYNNTNTMPMYYKDLSSLNNNIDDEINLVEDETLAGIYVCYLDYNGNINCSHYTNFISDSLNNYIILFYYFYSNSAKKITSYNLLGNNFNIIGSVNPSGDFDTLTYNAIGDSLTYGYVTSTTRLSIPYPLAVENQLNLQTSYNNGLTGTTVADDRTVMQSYYPMSADERMATYQNANIISVMGGTNDFSKNVTLGDINTNDATTFYGGYKKLLNYLITNNPSSFIFTITPPWSQSAPTTTNKKGVSKQDITNAIKEVSSYFGVACLDMNSLGQLGFLNSKTWTSDNTHFNQQYVSNIFAPKVANFIYNNLQKLPN